jgi:hypothetical protein
MGERNEAVGSMKLLVVGPDICDFRRVKNFTGVQAYYLARDLRRRGVELQFIDGKHPDPLNHFAQINGEKCDHALVLGLRWFTHNPLGCAAILKTKVKGAVTQLHDGLVHESLAEHLMGVDCTFTFRDDSIRTKGWERYAKTNHYIGWAADPDVLFPQQSSDTLSILIDHCYYKGGMPDVTAAVTEDTMAFVASGKWRDRYKAVQVRRLVNGGPETITTANIKTQPFDRKHIPFEDIAKEYRHTHVYRVTHKESVGLTCLELGFCGALTVAPKGMIYEDRLDTIRHLTHQGTSAPWGVILDGINIRRSAEKAREQTWDKVVERMLTWFGSYK